MGGLDYGPGLGLPMGCSARTASSVPPNTRSASRVAGTRCAAGCDWVRLVEARSRVRFLLLLLEFFFDLILTEMKNISWG